MNKIERPFHITDIINYMLIEIYIPIGDVLSIPISNRSISVGKIKWEIEKECGYEVCKQELYIENREGSLDNREKVGGLCPFYLFMKERTPIPNSEIHDIVEKWYYGRRREIVERYGSIEHWDTSQVIDMSLLFFNLSDFNDDISRWDTSMVIDMTEMFRYAYSFNRDISGWDVKNVERMYGIFDEAISFSLDHIPQWNNM